MNLVDVLLEDAGNMYDVTEALFRRVEPAMLGWKPATGANWMTAGQLLMHCSNACGMGIRGYLTGNWGLPDGMRFEDIPPEEMLPPASKLPAVESVDQALHLLKEDRQLALQYLAKADEMRLLGESLSAPWGGPPRTLFQQLQSMIEHLGQHKGQLFYYLKLMGQDVNTSNLWGM